MESVWKRSSTKLIVQGFLGILAFSVFLNYIVLPPWQLITGSDLICFLTGGNLIKTGWAEKIYDLGT